MSTSPINPGNVKMLPGGAPGAGAVAITPTTQPSKQLSDLPRDARGSGDEPVPLLIRRLKKQEGFFSRLNRKRRSFLGSMVARMIGGEDQSDYQFLPPAQAGGPGSSSSGSATIRDEIEESGV